MRRTGLIRRALVAATSLALAVTSVAVTPPAGASGDPTIAASDLAGPLRAGAFTQVLLVSGGGFDPSTMALAIEPDAGLNPGTVTVTTAQVISGSSATARLGQASAPGVYTLTVCIAPLAAPRCSAALATRVVSVRVAGPAARLSADPATQAAEADERAAYQVSVYDAADRPTLLAAGESVVVGAVADQGAASVFDGGSAANGLLARLRATGTGFFEVSGDTPGATVDATVAAVGWSASPIAVRLGIFPPPSDITVRIDIPALSVQRSGTAVIPGTVVDAAGIPLEGASVTGAVAGGSATTSATTDALGRFAVAFTAPAADAEQEVVLTASMAGHGTDTASTRVFTTVNGRTPITDLTVDGVAAAAYLGSITAPSTGTATEGSSAVLVSVVAAVPGAAVTFTSPAGRVSLLQSTPWRDGERSLEVTSDAVTGIARVWAFSTRTGDLQVTATAASALSAFIPVTAGAPRSIEVTAPARRISGSRFTVEVFARDAFGNAAPDALLDLALAGRSSGSFTGGQRQTTVRTGVGGSATAVIDTRTADRASVLLVTRGDRAACSAVNQFACGADEPAGSGFPAASGAIRTSIALVPPSVRIVAPARDRALSTNELMTVRAQAVGIRAGTVARVLADGREIGRGTVRGDGSVRIDRVRATGNGVFAVAVGELRARSQVRVVPFGITRVQRVGGTLQLVIATGVWRSGTRITVMRDTSAVARAVVTRVHRDALVRLPYRSGVYQVQVQTAQGVVPGSRRVTVQ